MLYQSRFLLCAVLFCTSFLPNSLLACTRVLFADKGPAIMVGRNMDWFESMPTKLRVYPRGIARNGAEPAVQAAGVNAINWVSQYGSTVAVSSDDGTKEGLAAVADGMNEKGLSAHLLVLESSDYGKPDGSKPGLSVIFWAQYYLDNFQTVQEAVEFTKQDSLQILPFYADKLHRYINVHMALEDSTGASAIIEYINGKPTIREENNLILTNDPVYDKQLENLKLYKGFGGDKPLPGTSFSMDRFVRASYYSTFMPKSATVNEEVMKLMSVMQNVSGVFDPNRPGSTVWHSISDLSNKTYYFNETDKFGIIWLQMAKFDLSPNAAVMEFDPKDQFELVGDVSELFHPSDKLTPV